MCQFVVVSSPSVHGQTAFSRQWGILAVSGYKTHEILIIYLEISTLYGINTILLLFIIIIIINALQCNIQLQLYMCRWV